MLSQRHAVRTRWQRDAQRPGCAGPDRLDRAVFGQLVAADQIDLVTLARGVADRERRVPRPGARQCGAQPSAETTTSFSVVALLLGPRNATTVAAVNTATTNTAAVARMAPLGMLRMTRDVTGSPSKWAPARCAACRRPLDSGAHRFAGSPVDGFSTSVPLACGCAKLNMLFSDPAMLAAEPGI